MKEISLSNGMVAYVDDEDYELVSKYTWSIFTNRTKYYARTNIPASESDTGKRKKIFIHQLITGLKGVDHKDNNGLNNQRSNLRPATASQNIVNKPKVVNGSSRYKGVSLRRGTNKWHAKIAVNYKYIHLGYFTSEEDAAKAYNEAAKIYYGEYAQLNILG